MSSCGAVRRSALPVAAAAVIVLAGCSGAAGDGADGPSARPDPSAVTSPTTGGPSDAPTSSADDPADDDDHQDAPTSGGGGATRSSAEEVQAAIDCLQGRWGMASFAVEAEKSVTTQGAGGDVVFSFEDDRWELWGGGQQPVTVTIGSREAELSVDGWAAGAMAAQPGGVRYELQDSRGGVKMVVPAGSSEHSIPMEHFLPTMVPTGTTGIVCDEEQATISSLNASVNQVLTLRR